MKSKNHTSSWKVGLNTLISILVFLLFSTLFDLSQGDISLGRYMTLGGSVIILITISLIVGSHKIIKILKNQLGN